MTTEHERTALIDVLIDEEGYPPAAARRIAERLLPQLKRYGQLWNLRTALAVLREDGVTVQPPRTGAYAIVWSEL